MSELNSQQQFDNIINKYLENVTNIAMGGTSELEIRFGTRGINPISKIDFDNVIQKLKSCGFYMLNATDYSLKIQSEYIDKQSGKTYDSNIRVEINGIHNIQKYCNTNSLTIHDINPHFTQKQKAIVDNNKIHPVNIDEYNMRVSYQTERNIKSYSPTAENIKASWEDNKKTFRYINRISFIHNDFPIRVDMSIVKSNKERKYIYKGRTQYKAIPEYTFESANILDNPEKYEIELEILNNKVGAGTDYNNTQSLMKGLKRVIKYVLSGLQNTNYPISYSEMKKIGIDYLKLVHGKEYNDKMKMIPRFFMGPSSATLQTVNITPVNDDSKIPNIRTDYTVTEKADGLRKLMYIDGDGNIYLIDTNMNIQFTGAITKDVDLNHSILDGEHILHNKKGEFINLYAAFDVYIINKKDVRSNAFIPPYSSEDEKDDTNIVYTKYRLPTLIKIIKDLNAKSIVDNKM